jgi:hypothetical protein
MQRFRPSTPSPSDLLAADVARLQAGIFARCSTSLVTVLTGAPGPRPYGLHDARQAKELEMMTQYLVVIAIIAILIGMLLPAVQ